MLFSQVEQAVRKVIPSNDLQLVLDNIGLSTYGVALAIGSNATVGPSDGDMLVQLTAGHKGSTADYVRRLRRELPRQFPGVTFFFQPADMVNQVLNQGLPAPIDVQVVGHDRDGNFAGGAKAVARDCAYSRRRGRARAAGDGRAASCDSTSTASRRNRWD